MKAIAPSRKTMSVTKYLKDKKTQKNKKKEVDALLSHNTHRNLCNVKFEEITVNIKEIAVPDLHFLKTTLALPLELVVVHQPSPFLLLLEFENRDWPKDPEEIKNVKTALLVETYKKICGMNDKKNLKPCGIKNDRFWLEYYNITYTVMVYHQEAVLYLNGNLNVKLLEEDYCFYNSKKICEGEQIPQQPYPLVLEDIFSDEEVLEQAREFYESYPDGAYYPDLKKVNHNTGPSRRDISTKNSEEEVQMVQKPEVEKKVEKKPKKKNDEPKELDKAEIKRLKRPDESNKIRDSDEFEENFNNQPKIKKQDTIFEHINPLNVLNRFKFMSDDKRTAIANFIHVLDAHGFQPEIVPNLDGKSAEEIFYKMLAKVTGGFYHNRFDRKLIFGQHKTVERSRIEDENGIYLRLPEQPYVNTEFNPILSRLSILCEKILKNLKKNVPLKSCLKPSLDDFDFVLSWDKLPDLEIKSKFKFIGTGQLTWHEKEFHKNIIFSDKSTLEFMSGFAHFLPSNYHKIMMVKIIMAHRRDFVLSMLVCKGNFQYIYSK
ncbi:hypothetical protein M153_8800001000 [Pseudoloma neurophilia]|uniref:Uncharacterized protein n=1 Tax=Pseudoloma neurophilia TaxID=146866 RepID=A0A0R0LVQ4_9MICR|nr:hypothetical protein M153_8800001000 [Pseudoloma neurophilia]